MTEAGWTREKPTAAGFWWWRQSDRVKYSYIVEVDSEMNVWFHGKEDESRVDYLTGEWLGPLTPDSYHQGKVAGLTFAAEQAGKGAELWDAGMKTREAEALREFQRWLQGKSQQA